MKAPTKPQKPTKPYPPDKNKKYNKHYINVDKLFLLDQYYDENGKEISENKYNSLISCFKHCDMQTTELTPSLQQLINLVPKEIDYNNIHIDLSLGYDSRNHYPTRPFEKIDIFYTTPFDYEKELEIYKKDLAKYDEDIKYYNYVLMPLYKKDFDKYKETKAKINLEKKKALLEAQLEKLNKK